MIIGDVYNVIKDGWDDGTFLGNGLFLIFGIILTAINIPILSLIYNKSEGLR
jgi:hypothetical protein